MYPMYPFQYGNLMFPNPGFSPILSDPPTLYAFMNSICNFYAEQVDKVQIRELAEKSAHEIFNFNYPLSDKIVKLEFEKEILNHFMMRRIGFQTFTIFQIMLETKLNEIMPKYNKLFDALEGWDLFLDGEKTSRTTNNTADGNSHIAVDTINDNKYSETPNDNIFDVQDGRLLTDYTYNQTVNTNDVTNHDVQNQTETITRSNADKVKLYTEFMNSVNSVYSMIFQELECLFLQVYI